MSSEVKDDLDFADEFLEIARASDDAEAKTMAALAQAHIAIWYAKEQRAYRDASATHRRMMQAATPPPPPFPAPPIGYNGF